MATGQSEITLRFLAAPTDVATLGGSIHGGRVLEWIDKAGYACAVGWSFKSARDAITSKRSITPPIVRCPLGVRHNSVGEFLDP